MVTTERTAGRAPGVSRPTMIEAQRWSARVRTGGGDPPAEDVPQLSRALLGVGVDEIPERQQLCPIRTRRHLGTTCRPELPNLPLPCQP